MKDIQNKRHPLNIIGAAGEYFVAGELSRRGIIATITIKNTPNVDIIATTPDGSKTVNIQVKTKQNPQGWRFTKTMENVTGSRKFLVVLVDLCKPEKPDYFIIPKDILARYLARNHKKWLAQRGRKGRKHRDNPIRVFDRREMKHFKRFRNKWEVMNLW